MMDSKICRRKVRYLTKEIKPKQIGETPVFDRQSLIEGWNQGIVRSTRVGIIGAGGNGNAARQLVRLGVGRIVICDPDEVELSNLNRQFFFEKDLYKNKATSLAENLVKEATCSSLIEAYPLSFQEVIKEYPDVYTDIDIGLALVDSYEARCDIARYFLENKTPLLICGVTRDCSSGYVFYQEDGGACFGCAFPPNPAAEKDTRCREPAAIYIHSIVTGIAVFVISQMLFRKKKPLWHKYRVFIDEGGSASGNPPIRSGCHICGGKHRR